jgi:HPt (histidine-containing phosphotransfer) domain-containing protein
MEMCREFLQHLPTRMEGLKTALQAGNNADLTREAHNLKGMAANFSAGLLTSLAAELEAQGQQDNLAGASELVNRIQVEAVRLREYLVGLGVKAS